MENIFISVGTKIPGQIIKEGLEIYYNSEDISQIAPNLEAKIAEFHKKDYAVSFCNRFFALQTLFKAIGITDRYEIVTNTLAHPYIVSASASIGAEVRLFDHAEKFFEYGYGSMKKALINRTKAAVFHNFAGFPHDMENGKHICQRIGIPAIEDASESFGSVKSGKTSGIFGDIGIISLIPWDKNADAAFILTSDVGLMEKLTDIRGIGDVGKVCGMSPLQASIASASFEKTQFYRNRSKILSECYEFLFNTTESFKTDFSQDNTSPCWRFYPAVINPDRLYFGKEDLHKDFLKNNVPILVGYVPLHSQPYFQNIKNRHYSCPNADKAYESIVCFPFDIFADNETLYTIFENILKVIKENHRYSNYIEFDGIMPEIAKIMESGDVPR